MPEAARSAKGPKFSLAFWGLLAFITVLLLGLLFPARSHPIIDKIHQVDLDAAQIRAALLWAANS